jgi:ribosome biogenesis GTPase
LSKEAQVIAANIDLAVLVATLANPRTELRFIDRFLVTAQAYKIPANLVFNKCDLYNDEDMEEFEALKYIYDGIGYTCHLVSAATGEGVEELRALLCEKTSLVSGNSGVGKSTLINAIDPALVLKTGLISDAHHKGKHTTTFAEMFDLTSGGRIIDTPGVKSFGMHKMEPDEVAHYFPEMFELLDSCKFYNCTHVHEPGCAVKTAVEEMRISPTRYDSYLNIISGDEDVKYRGPGY